LGSGAYGFKPYVVFSHTGRITPHANLAYQWNGVSALYPNQDYRPNEDINAPVGSSNGKLNLPGSLQYSAGADLRVTKKVTLVGDLIGQHVFSGVRLLVGTRKVQTPSGNTPPSDQAPPQCDKTQWTCPTILSTPGSYNMNSFGIGVKWNPVGGLLIFGNALIKLDDAGLRANVVPLAGVSYRF
jgi:hypothetical protein